MVKEYKTIREVAGPLMLVDKVSGVKYNELGTITLENGEKRRCKVLELNGDKALLQLFDSAAGLNLARFQGAAFYGQRNRACPSVRDMLGRVFDGHGRPH